MKYLLTLLFTLFSTVAIAKPVVFSGRVLSSSNLAIENSQTKFNIKITNSATCVLYEEEFLIDMTGTNGYFKLSLNGGSPQFNLNNLDIYRSKSYFCKDGSSWNATANDIRRVFISVKVGDEPWVNFSSDTINAVAYANEAESIGGKIASELIQSSSVTTQIKVDQILTQHQNILDLVNGTNSTYAKQSLVDSALSNKQNILSYTPINPSNNLSELTNTAAARSNLGLGSLATKSSITDSDISNINWSKIVGSPSSFAPSPHIHAISDVTNLSNNLNSKVDKVVFTCGASQVLSYVSISDTFSCLDITVGGDVSGSLSSVTVSKIQGKTVSPTTPQDGDVLKYNGTNNRWEPSGSAANSVPTAFAGEIITFPGNCPNGTVLANGDTLDRSANQELFNAYQCDFTCPNGTTFKIPDYRGQFLRMADNGAGVDAGRAVNTAQADEFKSHSHAGASTGSAGSHTHQADWGGDGGKWAPGPWIRTVGEGQYSGTGYDIGGNTPIKYDGAHTHTVSIPANGGAETRPKNKSINYCIRLRNAF